jgi:hypothetical protein
MPSRTVFIHSAGATGHHLLVDTLLGVGAGAVVVVAFLAFLRFRRRSRTEGDDGRDPATFDRLE